MLKQRRISFRQSAKDQLLKNPGYISSAIKRNKFMSLNVSNATLQINNPQLDTAFVANKYRSMVLSNDQGSKTIRKSSYQQYRQNRKNKIKQKWNGIVSERRGKLSISSISPDKTIKSNRSIVIHSRNSNRRNSYHTTQNFVEPSFAQLNSNSMPIPEKFNYLFQLIQKNQWKDQIGLISLSKQKSLSDRKQERKFRTRCCQKSPKINSKQGFMVNTQKKECRPWSGKNNQFLLHDLTSLQIGF